VKRASGVRALRADLRRFEFRCLYRSLMPAGHDLSFYTLCSEAMLEKGIPKSTLHSLTSRPLYMLLQHPGPLLPTLIPAPSA